MKHALTDIPGIGESTATILAAHGIDSVKALLKGGIKGLKQVPGFGEARAATTLAAAAALKDEKTKKEAKADKPKKGKDGKKKAKKKKKKG
jgi:nucleotidyltransferase/DNA polymerase involved in DNA repair